jgi:hypothetical protein
MAPRTSHLLLVAQWAGVAESSRAKRLPSRATSDGAAHSCGAQTAIITGGDG